MTKKTKAQLLAEIEDLRNRLADLGEKETEVHQKNHTEKRLAHLNLVLRTIRNVNQLIVREKNRDVLIQKVCDKLIETRGYSTAWIALVNGSDPSFTTVEAGLGKNFTPLMAQLKRGDLPACALLAKGKPGAVEIGDPASTCSGCPLTNAYADVGRMTVRLEHSGTIQGYLSVSTPGDLAINVEELDLLQEVAGDIAFALSSITTERKRMLAQEKVEHLTLVLRAIRNVNQLIIREKNRSVLIHEICDTLIETRGYSTAWIMLLDDIGEYMDSAESGLGKHFTPLLKDLKHGDFPDCAQKALAQPGPIEIADPSSTCADCPITDEYSDKGRLTIRLEHAEKIYGVLSVSFGVDITVDEEELSLFEEVTGDIAFALYSIEIEQKRGKAEEELQLKDLAFEMSISANSIADSRGVLTHVNKAFLDIWGYSNREEVIGRPISDFLSFDDEAVKIISALNETGKWLGEFTALRKDKNTFDARSLATIIKDRSGNVIGYQSAVQDISQKKQEEQKLRSSEERLSKAQRLGQLGFAELNLKTNMVLLSDESCRIYGFKPREGLFPHEIILEAVHPDDREIVQENFDSSIKKGDKVSLDHRIVRPDGEVRWVNKQPEAVFDADGNINKMLVTVLDITERVQAESALRNSEQFSEDILDAIRDGISVLDEDLTILRVNASIEAMYADHMPLTGKKCYQVYQGRNSICPWCPSKQTLEDGKIHLAVVPYPNEENPTGWIELTSYPLIDTNGKITGVIEYVKDITLRKQAQQKLQESAEYQKTIFETTPLPTAIIEEDSTISSVNKAFEKISGYSKEELEAKMRWPEFVAPEDLEKMKEYHRQRRIEPDSTNKQYEFRFINREGNIRIILLNVDMIPGTKKSVASLLDITERKQAEQTLRESENNYRNLADNTPLCIFTRDINFVVTFCNDAYLRYHKKSRADILGKSVYDIFLKETADQYVQRDKQVIKAGKKKEYESNYLKDGQIVWEQMIETPIKDSSGRIYGVLGVFWDITDRKRAEQEIKTLVNISRQASAETNLKELLFSITDQIVEVISPAEAASIFLHDEKREVIKVKAWTGFTDDEIKGLEFAIEGSQVGKLFSTKKPVLIHDVSKAPEFDPIKGANIRKIKSQMAVPLVYKKDIIGVIFADNLSRTHAFSQENLDLLESIGNQLAGVIEHARLLEKVRQSEEQYQSVVEDSPGLINRFTPDGTSTFANNEYCKYFGIRYDDLIGMNIQTIIPGYGRESVMSHIKSITQESPVKTLENEVIRHDGVVRWMHWVDRGFFDDDGRLTGIQSFGLDITANKQVEEELKKEQEKAQKYLDIAEVMIMALNTEGEITLMNQKGAGILGYQVEELIGKNWHTICVPAVDRVQTKRLYTEFIAGGVGFGDHHKQTILNKIGEERIIDWHTTRLWEWVEGKKHVIGSLSSGEDITEQVRAQEAIRREKEKAQQYLDIAGVAFLVLNKKGEITLINQRGNQILGYQEGELIGENWFETCLPERNRKEVKGVFRKLMAGDIEPVKFYENLILTRSGEERTVAWHNTILQDEKGNNIGALASGEDVTERKQAEERIVRLSRIFEDSLNEIFLFSDDTLAFIQVNSAAQHNLGYSMEELQKLTPLDIKPELTSELFSKLVAPLRKGEKKEIVFETVHKRKDQTLYDVEVHLQLMRFENKFIFAAIILDITRRKQAQTDLENSMEKLKHTIDGTVQTIAATVEARDPYTAGHQTRMADLAMTIAGEMGLAVDRVEGIRMAGVIHDLGKVQIPAEILSKPGKLSELEFNLIKTHPRTGFNLLKNIDFPWPIAEMVLQHHEKIDGSGYPQGLKGGKIMIEARILAVADTVEAMSSHRPYRPALGVEKALKQIREDRGTLFDPDVVDACLKIFKNGYQFPED